MKKTTLAGIFTAALALAGTFCAHAQKLPVVLGHTVKAVNPENGIIRCATTEYEAWLQENNSNRPTREQFEAWLAPKVAEIKAKRLAGKSVQQVITIPVVVHVIHNGDAVGVNENIPEGQVLAQIEVLNQDFRRELGTPGYNTNPVGADIEIEFCLAQTAPDGTATNGIHRVNLGQATYSDINDIDQNVKPNTSWDSSNYFNIWTVNIDNSSDLLGYAQFPNISGLGGLNSYNGEADTDGLVIGTQYFGSQTLYPNGYYSTEYPEYTYGRTATHEIGHCFGLLHPSGDNFTSCVVNATDSNKDYCLDTPATKQYNYTCNTNANSCPADPGNDMVQNYMDYTDDTCMNIFTQDQKDRMIAVMNNSIRRVSLKTSTVCSPPAATDEFNILRGINLYPNPTGNVINIALQSGNLPDSFAIYNNLGQQLTQVNVSSTASLTVNTSGYSSGIYFIKVTKGKESKTLKFIKE